MPQPLKDLQPKAIWKHFMLLNAIPRASKKEAQVIQFMKAFGENLGLETVMDNTGNLLIKKPATPGKESHDTVILQGHLDMVHQKNEDTIFDFATQGIDMYVDGDWVKAKGTTLGADNGIGVAAIMTVLATEDIVHPPIEAIFTIDEEIGMTGAMGLQKDFLSGSILLNLDSEEDDALTVGSAGGVDVHVRCKYESEELSADYSFYELIVNGLTGGHSGVDIHKGLSNAIKLTNRILYILNKEFSLRVAEIHGGDLTNAIPRECQALIAIQNSEINYAKEVLEKSTALLKKENKFSDPDLKITLHASAKKTLVLSKEFQSKLLASLYSAPNGIYRMTPSLNNLVQSSNNLAKIKLENQELLISCHTRSFIESERDDLVSAISSSFTLLDAIVEKDGSYPGWNPDPNTKIVKTMKQVYKNLHGNEPDIFAIHAGLECGILSEIYPHLDIISFGPNITGAHSPDEALQISSTQKFWKYLTAVLAQL